MRPGRPWGAQCVISCLSLRPSFAARGPVGGRDSGMSLRSGLGGSWSAANMFAGVTWSVHRLRIVSLLDALPPAEAAVAGDVVFAGQLDWLTVSWTHGLLPAALQFYTVHAGDATLRLWRCRTGRWSEPEPMGSPNGAGGPDGPSVRGPAVMVTGSVTVWPPHAAVMLPVQPPPFFQVSATLPLPNLPLVVRSAPFGYIAVIFPKTAAGAPALGGPIDVAASGRLVLYNYFRGGAELQLTAQWPLRAHAPEDRALEAMDPATAAASKGLHAAAPTRVCLAVVAPSDSARAARSAVSVSWTCLAEGSLALAVAAGGRIDVYGRLRPRPQEGQQYDAPAVRSAPCCMCVTWDAFLRVQ
jgi:hypothetical protein